MSHHVTLNSLVLSYKRSTEGQGSIAAPALAALLGLTHAERNGHHYVDGFGEAPETEQSAFAAAHPDLYELEAGRPRLAIRGGRIELGSLDRSGFAHHADPDFDSLRPLGDAASMVPA